MRLPVRFGVDAGARGDVGLAQARQDFGVEAGAVVGDRQVDCVRRPTSASMSTLRLGEVDGVLDQIAEAVNDLRACARR